MILSFKSFVSHTFHSDIWNHIFLTHIQIPQRFPQPNLSSATINLSKQTPLLFLSLTFPFSCPASLLTFTTVQRPSSWGMQYILYRCISTVKTVFKGSSHPEQPHLQTTKSRHFQSQVSDAVALVSVAPGHSCTVLTLQLSGGSSSKTSGDRHIFLTLTNTMHVVNPRAKAPAAERGRAEPTTKAILETLCRIITRVINDADRFSQTLSLCRYSLMMIYDYRLLMCMQWFITALKAVRLTNSDY